MNTLPRTYPAIQETVNQFLADYSIDPLSVTIRPDPNQVTILVEGVGAAADLISESLYWETYDNGITVANVIEDGTRITVQVYES